jgi:hypothetical protein
MLALLAAASPAFPQTQAHALQVRLDRPLSPVGGAPGQAFRPAEWDLAPARPVVSLALSDRLGVVASGFKDKGPRERWMLARPADGPAGRPRNPRAARVGLILTW